MKRIPFPDMFKKIMKDDVKYVWVTCPKCGCEWELTERKKKILENKGFICAYCFDDYGKEVRKAARDN
jgi:hypothetical protein